MDQTTAPIKIIQIRRCDVCNKDMAVTSLKRHKKIVHQLKIGKQIECADCGKLFQSKERLIQHLRLHALDAEENNLLSCTESAECKYKTNSRAYMSDHRRRIHKASARPGQWMCFVGSCQEKPRSFLNHHQHKKHQQDHANVNCPECNQLFSAKRNLRRHVNRKHKAVEANISRNSNESNPDDNFNPETIDIHSVPFQMCS